MRGDWWSLERRRVRLSGIYEWDAIRDFENPRWNSRCPFCPFRFRAPLHDPVDFLFSFLFFFLLFVRCDSPPSNRALSYTNPEMTPLSLRTVLSVVESDHYLRTVSAPIEPDEDVFSFRYDLVGRM